MSTNSSTIHRSILLTQTGVEPASGQIHKAIIVTVGNVIAVSTQLHQVILVTARHKRRMNTFIPEEGEQ